MTKTLSLKASKKLQEYIPEGLRYYYDIEKEDITENPNQKDLDEGYYYKTLTLEEAIEMLPSHIIENSDTYGLKMNQTHVWYSDALSGKSITHGYSILEAVEKMLLYLADNNLLK